MSVRFDATGEQLSRTTNLPLITAFTIMGWGKIVVDTNNWSVFLLFGNGDGSGNLFQCATTGDGVTLEWWNGSAANQTTLLTVGQWNHFAMTCSGTGAGQFLGYLNGVLNSTLAGSASMLAQIIRIGTNEFNEQLNGSMAAVKIWGAVLTAAEIQQEMRQYLPVRTANLNGFYPLHSIADDEIDFSGNGFNFTVGGTLTTEDGPPIPWKMGRHHAFIPISVGGTFSIDAALGTYGITGISAGSLANRMINSALGSYSLTGLAASLASGRMINNAPGIYSITGLDASILADKFIYAQYGVIFYGEPPYEAGLIASRAINAEPGFISYVGIGTGLFYIPITGFALDCAPGSYTLSGFDSGLLSDKLLVLEPEVYNLTGVAAIITAERFINSEPGTYTLIGSLASPIVNRMIAANTGIYSITGSLADLVVAVAAYILIADSGSYLIVGKNTRGQLEFDVFPIGSGSGPCPQIIND